MALWKGKAKLIKLWQGNARKGKAKQGNTSFIFFIVHKRKTQQKHLTVKAQTLTRLKAEIVPTPQMYRNIVVTLASTVSHCFGTSQSHSKVELLQPHQAGS